MDVHVGTWRLNRASGQTQWSPGLLRMMGLTRGVPTEQIPRFLADRVDSADRQRVVDGFMRMLRGDTSESIEFTVVGAGGSRFVGRVDVEVDIEPEAGKEVVTVILRDVTAESVAAAIAEARGRLLAFAADHTTRELLRATIDEAEKITGSRIGFYHFVEPDQLSLTLQTWSTATLERFCSAKGEGEHYAVASAGVWADCIPRREPIIHNDYESLPDRKGMPEGHACVVRELVVPTVRDGVVVAVLGVGNKSTDYDQHDVRVVSTLCDLAWELAALKLAQEALLESSDRLEGLFHEMCQGVVFQDARGVITAANDAASRMLGLTLEQMQGRSSVDPRWRSIHEDGSDFPGEDHPASVALRTGEPVHDVVMGVYNPRLGEYRWLEIDSIPRFRQGEDAPYEAFTTFTDITDRRAAEAARSREARLTAGLSEATLSLLSHATLTDDDILAALNTLGLAAQADRAYVFQHQPGVDGSRGSCSLKFSWTSLRGAERSESPRTQDLVWDEFAPSWYAALSRGEIVKGHVSDFTGVERDAMMFHGTGSVIEIPIFSGDEFWGFIGFDTTVPVREWAPSEVDMFSRAARSLGTAMELREQATRDPLTQLLNRRFADEALELELARMHREGGALSVMSVDVDHFKDVNDRFGHAIGDIVLQSVADQLRAHFRAEDIVSRVGGDEFLIILPGADQNAAANTADRLLRAIEGTSPDWLPDRSRLTISAGICEARTDDSAEQLTVAVDRALMLAKQTGRDRVALAHR